MALTLEKVPEGFILRDLTKLQEYYLDKYYPVVQKIFFGDPKNDIELLQTADHKRETDVLKFLHTVDVIFGEKPPKCITSSQLPAQKFILESCLENCRLNYRKQFRGYSYLTVLRLESAHLQTCDQVTQNIEQKGLKYNLSDDEISVLKNQAILDLISEQSWIEEVNNFKKAGILSEIKTDVLENLESHISEEFPLLFGENQTEFYENDMFHQKMVQMMATVLESFRKEIPFEEDKISEGKICEEFQQEVDKLFENLAIQNLKNKDNAKIQITAEVDKHVALYKNALTSFLNEELMAEPHNVWIQHKIQQEINIPVLDSAVENSKSKYNQKYYEETDSIFREHILTYSEKSSKAFAQCNLDLYEATNQFISHQVTQIFQGYRVPIGYIEQIRKRFHQQLENVIGEIRDSTIANPKIAENIALWGVEGTCKSISGSKIILDPSTEHESYSTTANPEFIESIVLRNCQEFSNAIAEIENRLESLKRVPETSTEAESQLCINISLHIGGTYKIYAHNLWTVKKLRCKLMKLLDQECESVVLYYKSKKTTG